MKDIFFEKNKNKYVSIFADCQVVKGFSRTSIYDLSRKKIYFIANSYFELTAYFKKCNIGEMMQLLDGKTSRLRFYKFLNFLLEENIAALVDDIRLFPELPVYWDSPSTITNAIIDIRNRWDFLPKVFGELSELRCEYLQLRFYGEIHAQLIGEIVSMVKGRCFKDVELLIKFSPGWTTPGRLMQFCKDQKNVRFFVHSTPENAASFCGSAITYSSRAITSCNNCGNISPGTLRIPSVRGFMENKLFNSCLNRKISVDEEGFIKNCPSMEKRFGHINDRSLIEVAGEEDFKKTGRINKDNTDICKDCELRYLCSDCRAYTIGNSDTGKPSKCHYDPYVGKWSQ